MHAKFGIHRPCGFWDTKQRENVCGRMCVCLFHMRISLLVTCGRLLIEHLTILSKGGHGAPPPPVHLGLNLNWSNPKIVEKVFCPSLWQWKLPWNLQSQSQFIHLLPLKYISTVSKKKINYSFGFHSLNWRRFHNVTWAAHFRAVDKEVD